MSWAKPDVKCVCIKAFAYSNMAQRHFVPNLPQVGQTYTVRAVETCRLSGKTCLLFDELRNLPVTHMNNEEAAFEVSSFRPLITKTQEDDVALFRHHLEGAPAGVDA